MSQQFADTTKIDSTFEQMSRETMPKALDSSLLSDASGATSGVVVPLRAAAV